MKILKNFKKPLKVTSQLKHQCQQKSQPVSAHNKFTAGRRLFQQLLLSSALWRSPDHAFRVGDNNRPMPRCSQPDPFQDLCLHESQ